MTEWMLGALVVCGAMLATIAMTAQVAVVFLRLGREQGRDLQYHEDLHAGGVGELDRVEPADVEPETGEIAAEEQRPVGESTGKHHRVPPSNEDTQSIAPVVREHDLLAPEDSWPRQRIAALAGAHRHIAEVDGTRPDVWDHPPMWPMGTDLSAEDHRWIDVDSHHERTADAADRGEDRG